MVVPAAPPLHSALLGASARIGLAAVEASTYMCFYTNSWFAMRPLA